MQQETKQQFHQSRSKGIGSSDIAAIIGVSPWKTKYQLWREKTGKEEVFDGNDLTEAGHMVEPVVASYFENRSGHRIIKKTAADYTVVHPDHDYIRVHPDREYFHKDETGRGTVECKSKYFQVPVKGELPLEWYTQLQYQIGTQGFKFGSIAWIAFNYGVKFDYEEFDFSPEFYDYLINEAGEFWVNNVLKDIPPPLTTASDVEKHYPSHEAGLTVEASQELYEIYRKAYEAKNRIKAIQADLEQYEESIKLAVGPAETVMYAGQTLLTWKKPKDSFTFDAKELLKDDEETYWKYAKPRKATRRLLLKPIK